MDESELMESLSFLPSSSLLFCDREGLGGRCGTPPESPTALGRLGWTWTWETCTRWCLWQDLAGRGGRPELSGVRPEDSLLTIKVNVLKPSWAAQEPDLERRWGWGRLFCGGAAPACQTRLLTLQIQMSYIRKAINKGMRAKRVLGEGRIQKIRKIVNWWVKKYCLRRSWCGCIAILKF